MTGVDLTGANLSNSRFPDVDLSYAMLVGALINDSDLRRAILRQADLATATFSGNRLDEADFTGAHLSKTVFARCHDLHQVRGLDSLAYFSPSCIDMETLRECLAGLPDEFLEGMGLEIRELEALRGTVAPAL
jgi:uncharacterized protein YjbI with pentapeptide repeats